MKDFSGIEFASEHNGTDVFRLIELAYEQGQKDGHSEQLGTNLAEVGTDCISRQAAIDTLENTKTAISENGERYIAKQNAIMRIDALPSAQPKLLQPWEVLVAQAVLSQPKMGKWIEEPNCCFRCSICGEHYPSIRGYMKYRFCPNCGAKMGVTE